MSRRIVLPYSPQQVRINTYHPFTGAPGPKFLPSDQFNNMDLNPFNSFPFNRSNTNSNRNITKSFMYNGSNLRLSGNKNDVEDVITQVTQNGQQSRKTSQNINQYSGSGILLMTHFQETQNNRIVILVTNESGEYEDFGGDRNNLSNKKNPIQQNVLDNLNRMSYGLFEIDTRNGRAFDNFESYTIRNENDDANYLCYIVQIEDNENISLTESDIKEKFDENKETLKQHNKNIYNNKHNIEIGFFNFVDLVKEFEKNTTTDQIKINDIYGNQGIMSKRFTKIIKTIYKDLEDSDHSKINNIIDKRHKVIRKEINPKLKINKNKIII
jgi:hypothetical protein